MKKPLILLSLIILFVGISIYIVSTEPIDFPNISDNQNQTETPNISNNQPTNIFTEKDFTLTDLDGNNVTLSDFKGKRIFLNFWASWCPPCIEEMPYMEKLYQEINDKDIVIVAVNIGETQNAVKQFMNENNFNFLVLLDTNTDITSKYGVRSIPTSFFIDSEGNISNTIIGYMNYEDMQRELDKM